MFCKSERKRPSLGLHGESDSGGQFRKITERRTAHPRKRKPAFLPTVGGSQRTATGKGKNGEGSLVNFIVAHFQSSCLSLRSAITTDVCHVWAPDLHSAGDQTRNFVYVKQALYQVLAPSALLLNSLPNPPGFLVAASEGVRVTSLEAGMRT